MMEPFDEWNAFWENLLSTRRVRPEAVRTWAVTLTTLTDDERMQWMQVVQQKLVLLVTDPIWSPLIETVQEITCVHQCHPYRIALFLYKILQITSQPELIES